MNRNRSLVRNMANRKVAGVAAGFADFFGIDVTLVRILFILGAIFGSGIGVFIYCVCWIAMPKDSSSTSSLHVSRGATTAVLLGLICFGGVWALSNGISEWIPAAFFIGIAIVVATLIRKRKSWKQAHQLRQTRRAQERWTEPSAQEAPPMYFGADSGFRIDSFYPPSPTGSATPPTSPAYPPVDPHTGSHPLDGHDPWDNQSGFQRQ